MGDLIEKLATKPSLISMEQRSIFASFAQHLKAGGCSARGCLTYVVQTVHEILSDAPVHSGFGGEPTLSVPFFADLARAASRLSDSQHLTHGNDDYMAPAS